MTAGKRGRPKKITNREKNFVEKFVQLGEVGKAAVLAGYSSKQYGSTLLKKPEVRMMILEAMEKRGITNELIAEKMREGLDAVYPKKMSPSGVVIQDNEPDFKTRSIFLEKVLKITGGYGEHNHDNRVTEKEIVIVVSPELLRGLQDTGVIDAEIISGDTNDTKDKCIGRTEEVKALAGKESIGEPEGCRGFEEAGVQDS